MSKAFYPTNDGHIGNLEKLSTIEIRELLKRQEDLLKKKSFVAKLPDKGEKIRSHIVLLQKALSDRDNITDFDSKDVVQQNGSVNSESEVNKYLQTDDSDKSLENCLNKLSISAGSGNRAAAQSDIHKHQYEVALERSEKNLQAGLKQPIKLNRNVKIQHVKDLPSEILKDKPIKVDDTKCSTDRLKAQEESAATPPQYKYQTTQEIDLQESIFLQQRQKQIQEELNAEIAAKKLAERLHIKTEDYNPEGVDMSYRNTSRGGFPDDVDSDDDNNDENDSTNYQMMTVPSDSED